MIKDAIRLKESVATVGVGAPFMEMPALRTVRLYMMAPRTCSSRMALKKGRLPT